MPGNESQGTEWAGNGQCSQSTWVSRQVDPEGSEREAERDLGGGQVGGSGDDGQDPEGQREDKRARGTVGP